MDSAADIRIGELIAEVRELRMTLGQAEHVAACASRLSRALARYKPLDIGPRAQAAWEELAQHLTMMGLDS